MPYNTAGLVRPSSQQNELAYIADLQLYLHQVSKGGGLANCCKQRLQPWSHVSNFHMHIACPAVQHALGVCIVHRPSCCCSLIVCRCGLAARPWLWWQMQSLCDRCDPWARVFAKSTCQIAQLHCFVSIDAQTHRFPWHSTSAAW